MSADRSDERFSVVTSLRRRRYDGSDGETLTGNFIDLFDADLPVITTQELEAGKSAFLYDITSLLDSDTPRFAYTGGVLKSDVTETADTTTFSIGGPTDATSATRLLGNGKYPESVTATVNGDRIGNLVWTWDNATSSLLIKVPHTADETVEITVEWGDAEGRGYPRLRMGDQHLCHQFARCRC